jgi:hypothetical protein
VIKKGWPDMLEEFDPIQVEAAMVREGVLTPRADKPFGQLGELERFFTEYDPRKWALWRISMVRQFDVGVLRQLTESDLVYLAGQTPEGYEGTAVHGVRQDRNKIAQNAERARVELARRATRVAWRQSLILGIGGVLLGAALRILGALVARAFP